jgi:hypothetical protein
MIDMAQTIAEKRVYANSYYRKNKKKIRVQVKKYQVKNGLKVPDHIVEKYNPKDVSNNDWERICSSFSDEN